MAVAVEVDRVAIEARRHELHHAERAGVAAAPGERIDALALAQHEPVLELVAEEVAAVLAPAREVERQRRQRVDDAKVAHLPAEDRLDADDADDDLGRNAVDLLGLRQPALVAAPEGDAGADPHRLDEAGAVRGPVLRRAGHRRHDVARHARDEACLGEGAAQPVGVEAAPLGDALGEADDVVAQAIGDDVGGAVVDRRRGLARARALGRPAARAPPAAARTRRRRRRSGGAAARTGRFGQARAKVGGRTPAAARDYRAALARSRRACCANSRVSVRSGRLLAARL